MSSLLFQSRSQVTISESEARELLRIQKVKHIVTLPADKGRLTVVMDKLDYSEKVEHLLMDMDPYVPSTVSEFKKFESAVSKTIDRLRKTEALKGSEALATKAADAAVARSYGLPKEHKAGVPLRFFVSLRGTPTFRLSR
ncbi:unnamed protein product [Dibothriocephalus latus]|uniref:Uncharacterized protein n=1 Tax=Dibothriocephalus latus TaxID=60516 RepID=A0A3P7LEW6_DIBLA|nr:unnamed protein product [Dibothriocephalus latus]